MGTAEIRRALESATAYLGEHPSEAAATDSPAVATLQGGLVVRVTGPDGAELLTDMVPSVGGSALAPSPGWLLRAAEASCVATLIAMRAATIGLTLDTVEVTVDSESDDRGILGIDEAVPAGPLSGSIRIRMGAAGIDPEILRQVAAWGVKHCPVVDALERAVPLTVEVSAEQ